MDIQNPFAYHHTTKTYRSINQSWMRGNVIAGMQTQEQQHTHIPRHHPIMFDIRHKEREGEFDFE
jgi:hypothetical protein